MRFMQNFEPQKKKKKKKKWRDSDHVKQLPNFVSFIGHWN